jgi:hypothetical protein
MRAGTETEKADARDFLIEWFDRQLVEGQGFGEAFTTSHYQIWLHGTAAARLLAVHYNDQRLLNATGKWFRHEFGLYDLLVRDGVIYGPGFRSPGPTSQLRNVAYALVKNRPLSGNPANPNSNFWKDYYNVGAWELKNVLALGDNLGGAKDATKENDLPILQNTLCAYVKNNDFVFLFPSMTEGSDVLYWVARINGQVTQAPYRQGTAPGNNPFPAPALAGATVTKMIGPLGAPACPPSPSDTL